MAVNKEIWLPDIVESYYDDNSFLSGATNEDEYVLGGGVVHIPNAAPPANATRNRTNVPATAVKRDDIDVTYALDEFTSDPTLITNREMVELSYDKRASVIRENTASMNELAGDWMLWRWVSTLTANERIATTGAAAAWGASGMTGNRKKLTAADIRAAQNMLDNQKVPQKDRFLLITPDMRDHLMTDADIKNIFYSNIADYKSGSIPEYAGFKIMVRAKTIRLRTDDSIMQPDAINQATDNISAIFWQKSSVAKALGNVSIFDNPDRAEYYGDLISFLVRSGGRCRRNDRKGVGLIVAKT